MKTEWRELFEASGELCAVLFFKALGIALTVAMAMIAFRILGPLLLY